MQPVSFNPAVSGKTYSNPAFGKENNAQTERKSYRYPDEYVIQRRAFYNTYRRNKEFANLSDQQLLNIAKLDASRDDKYKFNTYTAALVGVPVVDTFVRGTLLGAPKLSGRLKSTGIIGAQWIGALALAGIYNGIVDKITAVTPVVRRSEERHPVISSLLRLAGFAAVLVGGVKGVSALKGSVAKHFPGFVRDYNKVSKSLAKKINDSKLNTKIIRPAKNKLIEFAAKHPKIAGTGLTAALWTAPVLAIGTMFKAITDRSEKADKIRDTYNKLAITREITRHKLAEIEAGAIADRLNKAMAEQVDKKDASSIAVENPVKPEETDED